MNKKIYFFLVLFLTSFLTIPVFSFYNYGPQPPPSYPLSFIFNNLLLQNISNVNTTCESGGILQYNASSGIWGCYSVTDDLRFPVNDIKTVGNNNVPDYKLFKNNTIALAFSPSTMQQGFLSAQIPHSIVLNSPILPHFHWSKVSTSVGYVRWCIEYTWANINETFPDTTIECIDSYSDTAYKHIMSDMIHISGVGKEESSMLNIRIFRDATHVNDTLNEDAFLLEFDIHYMKNKLGEINYH